MNPPGASLSTAGLTGPPAFHLLAKPTGATCNLDCAYCFFLSKEMLYPGSRFRMADELLETYIRQLIEAHRTPHVTVAWQGGEPTLMGVDFFRRAHAYVEKYRRPGMPIEYTIQTNGTLIDDELAALFKEHDYLVGISIDGPPGDARRLPRGPRRRADVGAGPARARATLQEARRRVQHPDDPPPGERRPPARGLPLPARRPRLALHPVHPDHRAAAGAEDRRERSTRSELSPGLAREAPWRSWRDRPLYRQEGTLVTDRSVTAEQYGSLPHRGLRGMGPPGHRRGLRPDVRRRPGQLARRAGRPVRVPADLRRRPGDGAQRRRLLVRPLRRGGLQAGQHHRDADGRAGRVAGPAEVRPGQARHAAAVLPRLRRPLRLPRRLPQGPLHPDAGRRSRASTTCAPGTRRSSTTSTSRCGRCRRSSARAGRRRS